MSIIELAPATPTQTRIADALSAAVGAPHEPEMCMTGETLLSVYSGEREWQVYPDGAICITLTDTASGSAIVIADLDDGGQLLGVTGASTRDMVPAAAIPPLMLAISHARTAQEAAW